MPNNLITWYRQARPDDTRSDAEVLESYVNTLGPEKLSQLGYDDALNEYQSLQAAQQGVLSQLPRGIGAGMHQVGAGLYSTLGLLGQKAGIPEWKEAAKIGYEQQQQAMQAPEHQLAIPKFEQITGPRTATQWALGTGGQLASQAALSIASMIPGAAVGAVVGGAPGAVVGGVATGLGALLSSFTQNQNYQDLVNQGVEPSTAADAAIKGGLPAAFLDAIMPLKAGFTVLKGLGAAGKGAASRAAIDAAGKELEKGPLQSFVKKMAVDAGLVEAPTETLQELSIMASDALVAGVVPTDNEIISRMLNAYMAGTLGGLGAGAIEAPFARMAARRTVAGAQPPQPPAPVQPAAPVPGSAQPVAGPPVAPPAPTPPAPAIDVLANYPLDPRRKAEIDMALAAGVPPNQIAVTPQEIAYAQSVLANAGQVQAGGLVAQAGQGEGRTNLEQPTPGGPKPVVPGAQAEALKPDLNEPVRSVGTDVWTIEYSNDPSIQFGDSITDNSGRRYWVVQTVSGKTGIGDEYLWKVDVVDDNAFRSRWAPRMAASGYELAGNKLVKSEGGVPSAQEVQRQEKERLLTSPNVAAAAPQPTPIATAQSAAQPAAPPIPPGIPSTGGAAPTPVPRGTRPQIEFGPDGLRIESRTRDEGVGQKLSKAGLKLRFAQEPTTEFPNRGFYVLPTERLTSETAGIVESEFSATHDFPESAVNAAATAIAQNQTAKTTSQPLAQVAIPSGLNGGWDPNKEHGGHSKESGMFFVISPKGSNLSEAAHSVKIDDKPLKLVKSQRMDDGSYRYYFPPWALDAVEMTFGFRFPDEVRTQIVAAEDARKGAVEAKRKEKEAKAAQEAAPKADLAAQVLVGPYRDSNGTPAQRVAVADLKVGDQFTQASAQTTWRVQATGSDVVTLVSHKGETVSVGKTRPNGKPAFTFIDKGSLQPLPPQPAPGESAPELALERVDTGRTALDYIEQLAVAPEGGWESDVAKHFIERYRDRLSKVKVFRSYGDGRSYYDPADNIIVFVGRTDSDRSISAPLHEAGHSLTYWAVKNDKKFAEGIEDLRKAAAERRNGRPYIEYGLSGPEEFTAMYWSSKEFRDFLSGIEYKKTGQNILQRLWQWILKFFGIKQDSLLDEAARRLLEIPEADMDAERATQAQFMPSTTGLTPEEEAAVRERMAKLNLQPKPEGVTRAGPQREAQSAVLEALAQPFKEPEEYRKLEQAVAGQAIRQTRKSPFGVPAPQPQQVITATTYLPRAGSYFSDELKDKSVALERPEGKQETWRLTGDILVNRGTVSLAAQTPSGQLRYIGGNPGSAVIASIGNSLKHVVMTDKGNVYGLGSIPNSLKHAVAKSVSWMEANSRPTVRETPVGPVTRTITNYLGQEVTVQGWNPAKKVDIAVPEAGPSPFDLSPTGREIYNSLLQKDDVDVWEAANNLVDQWKIIGWKPDPSADPEETARFVAAILDGINRQKADETAPYEQQRTTPQAEVLKHLDRRELADLLRKYKAGQEAQQVARILDSPEQAERYANGVYDFTDDLRSEGLEPSSYIIPIGGKNWYFTGSFSIRNGRVSLLLRDSPGASGTTKEYTPTINLNRAARVAERMTSEDDKVRKQAEIENSRINIDRNLIAWLHGSETVAVDDFGMPTIVTVPGYIEAKANQGKVPIEKIDTNDSIWHGLSDEQKRKKRERAIALIMNSIQVSGQGQARGAIVDTPINPESDISIKTINRDANPMSATWNMSPFYAYDDKNNLVLDDNRMFVLSEEYNSDSALNRLGDDLLSGTYPPQYKAPGGGSAQPAEASHRVFLFQDKTGTFWIGSAGRRKAPEGGTQVYVTVPASLTWPPGSDIVLDKGDRRTIPFRDFIRNYRVYFGLTSKNIRRSFVQWISGDVAGAADWLNRFQVEADKHGVGSKSKQKEITKWRIERKPLTGAQLSEYEQTKSVRMTPTGKRITEEIGPDATVEPQRRADLELADNVIQDEPELIALLSNMTAEETGPPINNPNALAREMVDFAQEIKPTPLNWDSYNGIPNHASWLAFVGQFDPSDTDNNVSRLVGRMAVALSNDPKYRIDEYQAEYERTQNKAERDAKFYQSGHQLLLDATEQVASFLEKEYADARQLEPESGNGRSFVLAERFKVAEPVWPGAAQSTQERSTSTAQQETNVPRPPSSKAVVEGVQTKPTGTIKHSAPEVRYIANPARATSILASFFNALSTSYGVPIHVFNEKIPGLPKGVRGAIGPEEQGNPIGFVMQDVFRPSVDNLISAAHEVLHTVFRDLPQATQDMLHRAVNDATMEMLGSHLTTPATVQGAAPMWEEKLVQATAENAIRYGMDPTQAQSLAQRWWEAVKQFFRAISLWALDKLAPGIATTTRAQMAERYLRYRMERFLRGFEATSLPVYYGIFPKEYRGQMGVFVHSQNPLDYPSVDFVNERWVYPDVVPDSTESIRWNADNSMLSSAPGFYTREIVPGANENARLTIQRDIASNNELLATYKKMWAAARQAGFKGDLSAFLSTMGVDNPATRIMASIVAQAKVEGPNVAPLSPDYRIAGLAGHLSDLAVVNALRMHEEQTSKLDRSRKRSEETAKTIPDRIGFAHMRRDDLWHKYLEISEIGKQAKERGLELITHLRDVGRALGIESADRARLKERFSQVLQRVENIEDYASMLQAFWNNYHAKIVDALDAISQVAPENDWGSMSDAEIQDQLNSLVNQIPVLQSLVGPNVERSQEKRVLLGAFLGENQDLMDALVMRRFPQTLVAERTEINNMIRQLLRNQAMAWSEAKATFKKALTQEARAARIFKEIRRQTKRIEAMQERLKAATDFIRYNEVSGPVLDAETRRLESVHDVEIVGTVEVRNTETFYDPKPGQTEADVLRAGKTWMFLSTMNDVELDAKERQWTDWLAAHTGAQGKLYRRIDNQREAIGHYRAREADHAIFNNFVGNAIRSIAGRLEMLGTPEHNEAAKMVRKSTAIKEANRGDFKRIGGQQGEAIDKLISLTGCRTYIQFKDYIHDPILSFLQENAARFQQAKLTPDQFLEEYRTWAASGDRTYYTFIDTPSKWNAVKKYMVEYGGVVRWIASLYDKYGLLVQDDESGIPMFRKGIGEGSGLLIAPSGQKERVVGPIRSMLTNASGLHENTSWQTGELAYQKALELTADDAGWKKIRQYFTPEVWDKFVSALCLWRNDIAFRSLKLRDRPVMDLKRAFAEPGNVVASYNAAQGDIKRFCEELYRRESDRFGDQVGENFESFAAETLDSFNSFWVKLDKTKPVLDEERMRAGLPPSAPHEFMDARIARTFPSIWMEFPTYDSGTLRYMLERLAFHSSYGRDGKTMNAYMELGKRKIQDRQLRYTSAMSQANGDKEKAKQLYAEADPRYDKIKTDKDKKLFVDSEWQLALSAVQSGTRAEEVIDSFRALTVKGDVLQDVRFANELLRTTAGRAVQGIVTILQNLLSTTTPWFVYGVSRGSTKLVANIWLRMLRNFTGFMLESMFGSSVLADENSRLRNEIGMKMDTGLGIVGKFKAAGVEVDAEYAAGLIPKASSEWSFTKKARKVLRQTMALTEARIKPGVEPGKGMFPEASVLSPFKLWNELQHISMIEGNILMFQNMVMNGVAYIEQYRRENNGADPKKVGLTSMGWTGPNSQHVWDRLNRVLHQCGIDLEQSAFRLANKRRVDPNYSEMFTREEYESIASVAMNHYILDSNEATRPPEFFSNGFLMMIKPLIGWPIAQTVVVNDLFRGTDFKRTIPRPFSDEETNIRTFWTALKVLAVMAPVTITMGLLRDLVNERLLGKKTAIRSFRDDQSLATYVENVDASGMFGLWGTLANTAVMAWQGDNRGLEADYRIFALRSFKNLRESVTKAALQRDVDYQSVVRPMMMGLGGSGLFQYIEAINTVFVEGLGIDPKIPLFQQELEYTRRLNAENYLRAAGKALNIEVSAARGMASTPTLSKPHIGRMALAAYSDDPAKFWANWQQAVEDARADGRTDPAKYVQEAFSVRHPLSVFRVRPTMMEVQQMLDSMPDGGREAVQNGITLFNKYSSMIGAKPFYGRTTERSIAAPKTRLTFPRQRFAAFASSPY